MRDANAEAAAELLQDRLELLRLRTLLVGAIGIVGLLVCLVALISFGNQAVSLVGEWFSKDTGGVHVPRNLFQSTAEAALVRGPMLLKIGFVVIGVGGMVYMTRQALSAFQVRGWLTVMALIGFTNLYAQWDMGSVWRTEHRDVVRAVKAKEWTRVDQISSGSQNTMGYRYVIAQVGLVKPDAALVQLHGKALVDEINDLVLSHGTGDYTGGESLLKAADPFKPQVLAAIDAAVYGAPHTEIGLKVAQTARSGSGGGGAFIRSTLVLVGAVLGLIASVGLLVLWRSMARRLRWLRPWVRDAY
jgi:hypothetical protein